MEFKYIVGQAQEDLIKRANELINLIVKEKFDTLVFIDRSARPASWIVESFWPENKPLPAFIFICTGKKKNLEITEEILGQIEMELGTFAQENLPGKNVLIVDDIEKDGLQRKFVTKVIEKVYQPSKIDYFEWNKLGGMRLAHGLSYEDYGSFVANPDAEKQEVVAQIKKELQALAKKN